jgi:hypothetical protein
MGDAAVQFHAQAERFVQVVQITVTAAVPACRRAGGNP